ncbi:response regulator [Actinoplanes sp. NPDC026670]|uniref:response regulator n=1 Tax=Actinoplanes sp. NPDC026670 TaxID=3154700 RepID=UPI0033C52D5E
MLLVEDDADMRTMTSQMLELCGFAVLEATGPTQAITVCRHQPGPIDLMLMEVGLPGMSGRDLARLVAPLQPSMSVLYFSGLPRQVGVDRGLLQPGTPYVRMPFTSQILAGAVQSLLFRTPAAFAPGSAGVPWAAVHLSRRAHQP